MPMVEPFSFRHYLKADYNLGGAAAKALGIDVGGGGRLTVDNSSSQSNVQSSEIGNDTGISSKRSNNERLTKIEHIMESHGVDKNTQNSMRENYQEVERLDKSIAQHKSNIDSHNKTISYAENNSGEMSKDMTQDVIDHYQKLYGYNGLKKSDSKKSGFVSQMI